MSEDSSTTQLEQLMALAVSLHASCDDLQPRLLPGRIPQDCPLQIPVPPHTRLLGTLAHRHRFVIMLESDLPLNEARNWYRTRLAALNWKERGKERVWPEEQPTGESSWSDGRPAVELTFWNPSIQPLLVGHAYVTLVEREDATTLVHLHVMLNRDAFYLYQAQPKQPEPPEVLGPPHRVVRLLPTLFAPADAQLRDEESHIGPAEIQMTAETRSKSPGRACSSPCIRRGNPVTTCCMCARPGIRSDPHRRPLPLDGTAASCSDWSHAAILTHWPLHQAADTPARTAAGNGPSGGLGCPVWVRSCGN